jgi:hypothetical protein
MLRLSAFVGMAILGMALLVGNGASQDKKDTKTKSYTPPGWSALGLSKEQKADIAKIHGQYKTKIKALEDQIIEVKAQERQEQVKVLTDDQKDKLRKLIIPEDNPKKTDTKDKVKEDKKDKN